MSSLRWSQEVSATEGGLAELVGDPGGLDRPCPPALRRVLAPGLRPAHPARAPAAARHPGSALVPALDHLVVVGASTGGAEALRELLLALPRTCPPLVVVQHMPAPLREAFTERLGRGLRVEVRLARHGDPLVPGQVLVAPGSHHARLRRVGPGLRIDLCEGPAVRGFRPSVDVLFHSAARHAGDRATGVLLTGMGDDGAGGLLAIREAGGRTIVQDESSCVVAGMAREAQELGAAEDILPLARIPDALLYPFVR